jgi:pimeloyl-ACP methyl ester carboxylesterase
VTEFAQIEWRGQPLRIEYQWVGNAASAHPTVVFLHEGLGSVAMWKDFPERFCADYGFRGLVFSRYGYGQSTPRPPDEYWTPDFMHAQAHEVLPALFRQLHIAKPWLFGHSDGASIALLHAARFDVAGIVVVAPHIFVEDVSIASIEQARSAYADTDLRARLARYHADPDSAGTTCGSARRFAPGTSRPSSPRSAARCSPCRARTTNTAHSHKFAALPRQCQEPSCS